MKRIIVKNVSKKFRVGFKKQQGALERVINLFSGKEPKRIIWALKNISFTAKAGEIIGIIGENGSGKSTLLKIIARIYTKDSGKVFTKGKIVSLIGSEAGFDTRLTAKDNIYLCCSIKGLKQKEIKKRFKSIISFAELENFVNTKLYQFSSGMIARLAFSIAIHSIIHKNLDILLLDEFLAVGDEYFRKKCISKINELINKGATVIIVSHDLKEIEENCNRIIWMERGKIVKDSGKKIVKEYKTYEINKKRSDL